MKTPAINILTALIRFTFVGKNYLVTLTKKKTNSNYNVFAAVYEVGDKTAIVGTTFKETTTNSEVKAWAEGAIKRYNEDCNKPNQLFV